MRLLPLLLSLLSVARASEPFPKPLIILARGLIYPRPQLEKSSLLRGVCRETRDEFFKNFQGNSTKAQIKVNLVNWANKLNDTSIKTQVRNWTDGWTNVMKNARAASVRVLSEARSLYANITNTKKYDETLAWKQRLRNSTSGVRQLFFYISRNGASDVFRNESEWLWEGLPRMRSNVSRDSPSKTNSTKWGQVKEMVQGALNKTADAVSGVFQRLFRSKRETPQLTSLPLVDSHTGEVSEEDTMDGMDDYLNEDEEDENEARILRLARGNGLLRSSDALFSPAYDDKSNFAYNNYSGNSSELCTQIVKSTLRVYDKVNTTLNALFDVVQNETLSIPATKIKLAQLFTESPRSTRGAIRILMGLLVLPAPPRPAPRNTPLAGLCNATKSG